MERVIIILITVHGLIHFLGFTQAFRITHMNGSTEFIPKFLGLIWLTSALLFVIAVVFYSAGYEHWWLILLVALIVSQNLIFTTWNDAKFGTVVNSISLFIIVPASGVFQ